MDEHYDIEGLQRGSDAAFREMVEQFQDRVFNTCLGFLGSVEEAEDVAQETFMEVFSSIGRFRGDAKLSTWIYRISVSKCLEHIRKKRTKKRFAFMVSIFGAEQKAEHAANSGPHTQLEDKERALILDRAINALPESQRVAFTLHKVEGLSQEEICSVMQTTISGVESLLHRAKQNLRTQLYAYYKGEER